MRKLFEIFKFENSKKEQLPRQLYEEIRQLSRQLFAEIRYIVQKRCTPWNERNHLQYKHRKSYSLGHFDKLMLNYNCSERKTKKLEINKKNVVLFATLNSNLSRNNVAYLTHLTRLNHTSFSPQNGISIQKHNFWPKNDG